MVNNKEEMIYLLQFISNSFKETSDLTEGEILKVENGIIAIFDKSRWDDFAKLKKSYIIGKLPDGCYFLAKENIVHGIKRSIIVNKYLIEPKEGAIYKAEASIDIENLPFVNDKIKIVKDDEVGRVKELVSKVERKLKSFRKK